MLNRCCVFAFLNPVVLVNFFVMLVSEYVVVCSML